jgi:hypothetical protein
MYVFVCCNTFLKKKLTEIPKTQYITRARGTTTQRPPTYFSTIKKDTTNRTYWDFQSKRWKELITISHNDFKDRKKLWILLFLGDKWNQKYSINRKWRYCNGNWSAHKEMWLQAVLSVMNNFTSNERTEYSPLEHTGEKESDIGQIKKNLRLLKLYWWILKNFRDAESGRFLSPVEHIANQKHSHCMSCQFYWPHLMMNP